MGVSMAWAVIAAAVLTMIAFVLLRRRYGHLGRRVSDAVRDVIGERGRRYLMGGFYLVTFLGWLGLFLWAKSEGRVSQENPFDKILSQPKP